jgi:hypothetical protein
MFTEDLAAFLSTDDFAETVTRAGGATVPAIFESAYLDPLGVAGSDPVITAQASVALVRLETLTIRGAQYQVRTIEPDGTGMVLARLSKL